MHIGSPHPPRKARIEIIPLIDIMFFLLASFLMASLSMIRLQSVKMDLPPALTAKKDFKPDNINIAVDKAGKVYLEKRQIEMPELYSYLSNAVHKNTNVPVYVSGDKDALNGMITPVLAAMRQEGIQKVSFAIAPDSGGGHQRQ